MNKTANLSTLPTPTPEEIAFYVREGKRLQSKAVHSMLKSAYQFVSKSFSTTGVEHDQDRGKSVGSFSGHQMHGN